MRPRTLFSDLFQSLDVDVDRAVFVRLEDEESRFGVQVHARVVLTFSGKCGSADESVSESLFHLERVAVSGSEDVVRALFLIG